MSAWRKMSPAALVAALAIAIGGCGVSTDHPPTERGSELATNNQEGSGKLTPRPPDTIVTESGTGETLAPLVAGPFLAKTAKRVTIDETTADKAFNDLCTGRVDVIEPGKPIGRAEEKVCKENHFDLVGPLLVGSDAVVLATKNEADVGGDCLTTEQARSIFAAGSPYDNWNQLGFYNIPLSTTGSLSQPVVNELFARSVLGVGNTLNISDLRGDFVALPNDEAVRRKIIGTNVLTEAHAVARHRLETLRAQTAAARQRYVENAVARADRRVLRHIEAVNERNRRLKIHVDAQALIRHNAEIDEAAKRAAEKRANARFDARLAPRVRQLTSRLLARALTPGVIGFVRFSYYEQWEEQLRPMEIWDETSSEASKPEPNCVFPSSQTVSSGHYPYAFQLVAYTTRQALARTEVRDYLLYLLANASQIATKAGLVPITNPQRDAGLLAIGVQPPTEAEPEPTKIETHEAPSSTPSQPEEPVNSSGVPGVGSGVPPSTGSP
jgi:ABC-type phosphate transport system substrate-binding protein